MPVIAVKPMWSPHVSAVEGNTFHSSRGWTVHLTPASPPEEALVAVDPENAANRVARWGERYGGHEWLICRSVVPRRLGPDVYEVIAGYNLESPAGFANDPTGEQGPLGRPSDIRWDFVTSSEQIDEDVDGKPIVNAAGERFDPPPAAEYADPRLTVTRYERDFSAATAISYSGRWGVLNEDPFMGALPGQALMKPIVGTRRVDGEAVYWAVTYVVVFREGLPASADGLSGGPKRAWWIRLLNQGYTQVLGHYGDGGTYPGGNLDLYIGRITSERGLTYDQAAELEARITGTPITERILDVNGQPTATPVLLDRAGKPLKAGEPPVWLEFNRRPYKPFSVFHLP